MAIAAVYDEHAAGWEAGAGAVYGPLAAALVDAAPLPLAGRLVLDVGSGTGAVALAAARAGARVVAADQSRLMIAQQRSHGWPGVAGDAFALPFPAGAFDGVVAGFLLNQLAPAPALAELVRVVAPGGILLASTWDGQAPDEVKMATNAVIAAFGWTPPPWFVHLKEAVEPISGDPPRLAAEAKRAGLVQVSATVRRIDLGLRNPAAVVGYRFALPHIAAWLATLEGPARRAVTAAAVEAATPVVERWRPAIVVLTGRVAG